MNKAQQSQVFGGGDAFISDSFTCYCGFAGGPNEGFTFAVTADSIGDALFGASGACGGRGATCSGD